MKRSWLGFAFLSVVSAVVPATAMEGCKAVQLSCSAMYANCEKVCGRTPNVARCVAASCDVNMPQCKSDGIWRSRNGSNACWTTSKRS